MATTKPKVRKVVDYYRTEEVAEKLKVSPKTIARWSKEGKLPFTETLGGHRRYPQVDIDHIVDELAMEASQRNTDAVWVRA